MPLYRTCTLVCDRCSKTTLGQLVGEADVLHPEGWQVDGELVRCPDCTSDHVFAGAGDEVAGLYQLVADLVEWADAPQTRGLFMMAESHNYHVTEIEAAAAQALWDRARAIANKRPKTGTEP